MKKIKRALISVYDKKKLKNLLKILKKNPCANFEFRWNLQRN